MDGKKTSATVAGVLGGHVREFSGARTIGSRDRRGVYEYLCEEGVHRHCGLTR